MDAPPHAARLLLAATGLMIAILPATDASALACRIIKREWQDGCLVTWRKCTGQNSPAVGLHTYRTFCRGTIDLSFTRSPGFWRQRRK